MENVRQGKPPHVKSFSFQGASLTNSALWPTILSDLTPCSQRNSLLALLNVMPAVGIYQVLNNLTPTSNLFRLLRSYLSFPEWPTKRYFIFGYTDFCLSSLLGRALKHLSYHHIFDQEEQKSSDFSCGNWELQHHLSETVFTYREYYTGTLKISILVPHINVRSEKDECVYPQSKTLDL